jgi:uncharacterized protein (DUF849 family)
MARHMLIHACLNGARRRDEHPALPCTPEEIAVDALAAVRSGAAAVHVHPRGDDASESLWAAEVRAVCDAVPDVCVWTIADARLLVAEGLDAACVRVLVEVDAVDAPREACALAAAIDFVLDDGLVQSPRMHHGGGVATWSVIQAAMERGHDVRIGLEDTLVWPDGTVVDGNAALVARVAELAIRAGRVAESPGTTQPG